LNLQVEAKIEACLQSGTELRRKIPMVTLRNVALLYYPYIKQLIVL
jgi:hypothetical protein